MKFFGRVVRGQKNNQLDFGRNLDHDHDPGIIGVTSDDGPFHCRFSRLGLSIIMLRLRKFDPTWQPVEARCSS